PPLPRGELEIIVCKPLFPSGEGCRRSGGGVCRDDRPRSSVVIAAAGWSCYNCQPSIISPNASGRFL
ncbi:MAG: hypothetical protein FWH14_08825, partial [Oscillospiraceae bacterium]|nr:hypothetical protein [Oscillospiraceae bacterium]